jgi:hypothetical protein
MRQRLMIFKPKPIFTQNSYGVRMEENPKGSKRPRQWAKVATGLILVRFQIKTPSRSSTAGIPLTTK